MAIVIAALVLASVPHLLPLNRVAPRSAAAIWLLSLGLRAGVALTAALAVLVFAPQSEPFQDLARACWHAAGLDIPGHPLADAATALPLIAAAASLAWVAFGLVRSAAALRAYLRGHSRGRGPSGSTLVDEADVMLAASTLGRPRVVVSDGAVEQLDPSEMTAAIEHEFGHLRLRHRPLLVMSQALGPLSRPVPGARSAGRALRLSLERDADEYAVARTRDPLALASAICKAAASRTVPTGLAALGGSGVGVRLHQLVDHGGRRRSSRAVEHCCRALAALMAATALALLVSVPVWAAGSAVSVRAAHLQAVATTH